MNSPIHEALRFIDPADRDVWVRTGMALKSEFGDGGFDVWRDWSSQAESYNERDARDVWRSIRAGGGVGIGTLLHLAREGGWRGDHRPPTAEELAERTRASAERDAREQAIIERERADAATKAAAILRASTEARGSHPYLERKQVSPVETLREIDAAAAAEILGYVPKSGGEPLVGRLLVVPVRQGERLSTLELIDGTGRKAALAGRGTKAGGFWATERLPDGDGAGLTLLIGEGMATTLSASAASGCPGVAALSSGNLQTAACAMRERYPAAVIVILADLVKSTGAPDPHAIEAARVVGGRLAIPDFGPERAPEASDFNDVHAVLGADAVNRAIRAAKPVPRGEPRPVEKNAPTSILTGHYARDATLIRASDLKPEPIDWLWDGWLAAGKVHILGGQPGTGKTTIGMALAATVSSGGRWPDGTRAEVGNVVIWSGEDDPADTLVPRLLLSGADLSRVFFVGDVLEGSEQKAFDPARDMQPLARRLDEIGGARLLIVDPIVSAVAGDSHKNAEVRRGLQPLVDLAGTMRCALLGITHFSKGTSGRDPVERITGSLAFAALARVAMVAAKHQEEGDDGRTTRLFCRAKSNIGPDDGGFHYDLHQAEVRTHPGVFASSVRWGASVEGSARDLLAVADATGDDGEGGSLADAKLFLEGLLADGPLPTKSIKSEADGAGHSWATIRRARKVLKIEAVKEGGYFGKAGKQQWAWRLPGRGESLKALKNTEDAQQKMVSTFSKIEHLQQNSGAVSEIVSDDDVEFF